MKLYQRFLLAVAGIIVLGSCIPLAVDIRINNQTSVTPEKTAETAAKVTVAETQSQPIAPGFETCREIVLPQPTNVKELPPNIRDILQNDTDRGLILMAEYISSLKKAYIDYRTGVNVAFFEHRRSCKK